MGLSLFFFKYHPLTLFDTDDWTYLSFTRQSKLLPNKSEWNPIKVLPENLMPLAGYIGSTLFLGSKGFYDAVVNGMGLVFALFIHFIPFLSNGAVVGHFFTDQNLTCIYNYTIPTLLNAILICLMVIHETISSSSMSRPTEAELRLHRSTCRTSVPRITSRSLTTATCASPTLSITTVSQAASSCPSS